MGDEPKILSIATVTPPHSISQEEAVQQAKQWVSHLDSAFQNKVERIFKKAEVQHRHTILALEEIFQPMSLQQKNDLYRQAIIRYSEEALKLALTKADLRVEDIDCLITISCTGHMSPSLDAFLINRLGMRQDVHRLPVMEMGCIGGAVGLMYAENYLRAYPDQKVALIAAELTSITFQRDDYSWANIVSSAIFGDGIACAILGASEQLAPSIVNSGMYHFPNTTDLLGFNLCDTGFRMVLEPELPTVIRSHFAEFIKPVLNSTRWDLKDIHHLIVHPGGKTILHALNLLVTPARKEREDILSIENSWSVFRSLGNMSSATVLFILHKLLERPIPVKEKSLLMGFGPGLTAATVALEWK